MCLFETNVFRLGVCPGVRLEVAYAVHHLLLRSPGPHPMSLLGKRLCPGGTVGVCVQHLMSCLCHLLPL